MPLFPSDFKKFKHVSSDDKTTTLKHDKGHELKIAHKALSPTMRKQLEALGRSAVGKEVKEEAVTQNPEQAHDAAEARQSHKMAGGGGVEDELRQAGDKFKKAVGAGAVKQVGVTPIESTPREGQSRPDARTHTSTPQPATSGSTYKKGTLSEPASPNFDKQPEYEHESHTPVGLARGGEICYACGGTVHMQQGGQARTGSDEHFKQLDNRDTHSYGQSHQGESGSSNAAVGSTGAASTGDVRTEEQKKKAAEISKQYGYAQGGKVQHYAMGSEDEVKAQSQTQDQVPQDVSSGASGARTGRIPEGTETASKANTVAIDPDIRRKQELYNKELITKMGSAAALGGPANAMMSLGTNSLDSEMFSGNKQPQHFDPESGAKAEQAFQQEKANNAANAASAQQQAIQDNSVRTQFGMTPVEVPNVPTGPQIPGSEQVDLAPKTQQTAQVDPLSQGMSNMQGMIQGGYNKEMQGISAQANAQAALGQQQEQILHQQQQDRQTAMAAYQQKYDVLNQEREALMHDVQNGHIDAEQYWHGDKDGNGGHSKIMAGIGIILAGFNPTNNPNAAIQYLNKQMDNNIQAQKENLGMKQNLLSANLRQFGNMKDAMEMTRLQQSDMMVSQLQEASAKASSPLAKAAGMQAAGKLQAEYAPKFQQFAMKQSLMSLAQGGGSAGSVDHMLQYMRVTNPEMAKEMEARYVPNVGLASIPVPEKVRGEMVSHQKLSAIGQDVLEYSKKHTNLVPGTAEYNTGVQKAQILQQAIREGLLGTVYRESEKPLLEKFVDDNPAGALKMLSSQPKIRTILQSNQMQLNLLKQSYGLPQQKQAAEEQFKTVNGVKYKRGPNGEAVPVK